MDMVLKDLAEITDDGRPFSMIGDDEPVKVEGFDFTGRELRDLNSLLLDCGVTSPLVYLFGVQEKESLEYNNTR